MSNYVLSCCSTADLSKEHFEKRDIKYTCFKYYLDDVCYPDDLGQTMSFEDFYQKMVDGAETRTAQVNMGEYMEYFEPFLAAGKDVLHLCLSSGISGSYNSCCMAAEQLAEKYPDRRLYIVDSLAAASGYGLLMDKLAQLRSEGMDIDTLRQWAEDHKLEMHHWFFSSDLTFFIKGGRISKTAGTVGMMLGICPLMNVSNEGKLIPRAKIRSKKRVIKEIVKVMTEQAENGLDYDGKCYMCHYSGNDGTGE